MPVRSLVKWVLVIVVLSLADTAIGEVADIAVSKQVDNPAPLPGNSVEFTITVSNDGPQDALSIDVTDRLPAGLSIPAGMAPFTSQGSYEPATGLWQVGGVSIGQPAVLTIPALAAPANTPTCYENVAAITDFSGYDDYSGNDAFSASVLAGGATYCADLVLTVSPTTKRSEGCGRNVTFDVTVRNNGPASAFHVEATLTGVPQGLGLGPEYFDPVIFDEIRDGESVTGKLKWYIECKTPEQFVDYSVELVTGTLLAPQSVTEVTDEFRIPKSGPCDCPVYPEIGYVACFIATAAYGSPLEPQVESLRDFRDRFLVPDPLGRRLVDIYYRVSPPIAGFIAGNEALRATARAFLAPVVVGAVLLEPR